MQATYDDTLSTAVDRVRFTLGDTGQDVPFFYTDAGIVTAVARVGSEDAAALELAEGMERQIALRPVRESADGASADFSSRLVGLRATITRLRGPAVGVAGPRMSVSRVMEIVL